MYRWAYRWRTTSPPSHHLVPDTLSLRKVWHCVATVPSLPSYIWRWTCPCPDSPGTFLHPIKSKKKGYRSETPTATDHGILKEFILIRLNNTENALKICCKLQTVWRLHVLIIFSTNPLFWQSAKFNTYSFCALKVVKRYLESKQSVTESVLFYYLSHSPTYQSMYRWCW